MYGTLFNLTDDFLQELTHVQQQFANRHRTSPIRQVARGTFPALNLGVTPTSVEVFAFLPGMDAKQLDIQIDKNLLTLQGEREVALPNADDTATIYAKERFSGKFKRVVTLPDDVDVDQVKATYRDGVLRISLARKEETLPKRIEIQ